jgi:hypothetical protein
MHRSLRRRARLALPSAYSRRGMAQPPPPQLLQEKTSAIHRSEAVCNVKQPQVLSCRCAPPRLRRPRLASTRSESTTIHFLHSIRSAQHRRRQSQCSTNSSRSLRSPVCSSSPRALLTDHSLDHFRDRFAVALLQKFLNELFARARDDAATGSRAETVAHIAAFATVRLASVARLVGSLAESRVLTSAEVLRAICLCVSDNSSSVPRATSWRSVRLPST